jgi:hypothetical protein
MGHIFFAFIFHELLLAISLFSDKPSLDHKHQMTSVSSFYLQAICISGSMLPRHHELP